ncbi:hypothetical protein EV175_000237 [Coemansia sp. RSA 1933]|nr:hypothetical protein EV175_000237 [Coemansia sp. RSA 1933]
MRFAIAIGLFSALAQAGLGQKCIERPSSSASDEYSTSSTTDVVYSAVPMPSEYSDLPSDTVTPSSTPPAMYSTIPMPSDFSETYADTTATEAATTTTADETAAESTASAMYSTIPMPSDFSETYLDTTATETDTTAGPVYSASSSEESSSSPSPSSGSSSSYYQITLDDLNKAVPDRAGDDSCSAATYASECATNSRAVTAINNALTKYQITGRGEAVAVIAVMAYESDSWLYNINHNPGRPGQGTRNMQMYNFNSEYAQLLYPTQASAALASGTSGSDAQENAVLDLVLGDDDSFGSGFWYLVNHASSYYNSADKLRDGNSADFQDYVVNGVGASWTDDRLTTWTTINSALSS